jgi:hypothetical protein
MKNMVTPEYSVGCCAFCCQEIFCQLMLPKSDVSHHQEKKGEDFINAVKNVHFFQVVIEKSSTSYFKMLGMLFCFEKAKRKAEATRMSF